MSLDYNAPLKSFDVAVDKEVPKYLKKRILGGLVTDYSIAA